MEPLSLILTGVVLFLSSVAQSAVGFGYALYATPLLVWLGIPLPHVITVVATCSMLQSGVGAVSLRADIPWRDLLLASAIRLLTMIAGLLVLTRFVTLEPDVVRAIIGVALCLIVIVQMTCRPQPRARVHAGWTATAFLVSGFLAGFCGMGGPALVLWLMAHDWTSRKSRGFLFGAFALSIPVQLVMMIVAFGPAMARTVLIGIACLPLVYAGAAIGLPLGNRLSSARLRTLSYALLLLIGLASLISGVRWS